MNLDKTNRPSAFRVHAKRPSSGKSAVRGGCTIYRTRPPRVYKTSAYYANNTLLTSRGRRARINKMIRRHLTEDIINVTTLARRQVYCAKAEWSRAWTTRWEYAQNK